MQLSIRTELDYDFPASCDVLLELEAAVIPEQAVLKARIDLPRVEHFARVPGHDTIGDRIWLRHQGNLQVTYSGLVEVRRIVADIAPLAAVPPHQLPGETVQYLLPSRYCPSYEFQALVEDEFAGLAGGARVHAISEWIARHIAYVPGSSGTGTDAMETYVGRHGVCRDFAHLLITMARASAIPARFASVYGLGVTPQDFHAVAEVFLEGCWYMVDATGMSSPDRMAKIGVGRDAADVSFLTSYGVAVLKRQMVDVSEA
jgi:transglutaminase-like putative cysteine protease